MVFYSISIIVGGIILVGGLLYKLIKRIRDYRHYKDIGMNSLKLQQIFLE